MMCSKALLRGGLHMYLVGGSFPAQRQAGINTYRFTYFLIFAKMKQGILSGKMNIMTSLSFKLAS